MKISENWLREWVNPKIDTDTLVSQLTMAGLEVKGLSPAAPDLENVVVAEVVTVEKHPNADKLNVCQVNDGSETRTVVCGADNVRAKLKVALARVGAVLPEIKIEKAMIRGLESHGMICSASELQMGELSEDILELPDEAPVGTPLVEYLALDDSILEIDLTPNRGDCLSIAGVAREVSAANRMPVEQITLPNVINAIDDSFPVELEAPEHCPRYAGRIIRGIDPQATTPLWMQEKLRRCGLRPISPVVDVTNFVMMELGQPMHGFDFDKLNGGIKVRLARAGEKIFLLDQSELECSAGTLLIADHDNAVALAGIMGGQDSSVQADTRNIFLEAAHFNALPLAGKARSYGMHTDASHRFERGVDAQLPVIAINRATELLLAIAGGQAGTVIDVVSEQHMPQNLKVKLRHQRVIRLLGIEVSKADISDMLQRLNMEIEEQEGGWLVMPPSYRFDINIEADLIEEIGRLIGYNNIPGSQDAAHARMDSFSEQQVSVSHIRDLMVAQGYFEAITYSFVSPELQAILDPAQQTLTLSNPISADMSVMRTRLLPGLVQALQHNLNRQQSRVRLFETGLCFIPGDNELEQTRHIAGLISGIRSEEGVYSSDEKVDFFDIKGDLESLLGLADASEFEFRRSGNPVLHPGQGADIYCGNELIGFAGGLHPVILKKLGLDQAVFVFEIILSSILSSKLPNFAEMSRYPSIRRDISLSVDADTPVQELIDCVLSIKNEILREVFVFDVYTGKDVRNNRKSVALGLILQDFSRTLVDKDVENLVEKVLVELKEHYNAVLREN